MKRTLAVLFSAALLFAVPFNVFAAPDASGTSSEGDAQLTAPDKIVWQSSERFNETAVSSAVLFPENINPDDFEAFALQYDWSVDGGEWSCSDEWGLSCNSPMSEVISGGNRFCLAEAFWLYYEDPCEKLGSAAIISTRNSEFGTYEHRFDFENHTLSMRLRFAAKKDGKMLLSEWSEPAPIAAPGTATAEFTEAPLLSAVAGDENSLRFGITYSDALIHQILSSFARLEKLPRLSFNLTTSAGNTRILNDFALSEGTLSLPGGFPSDGFLSLTVCVAEDAPEDSANEEILSPASNQVVIGAPPASGEASSAAPSSDVSGEEPAGTQSDVCPVCGFCAHPFGICVFIIAGAALILVAVIAVIVAYAGHKRRRRTPW